MTVKFDQLEVEIFPDQESMGRTAAEYVGGLLREAINERGSANVILATGNSQLGFLKLLCGDPRIDWGKVRIFHMDEYIGITEDHPASFVRYMRERVADVVHPLAFFPIRGDTGDPQAVCDEYEALLRKYPADVCCMGLGENGHIAFNEPHVANFEDDRWVRRITLDERSRAQQVGEGHFPTLDSVPTEAISLTIPALLSARHLLIQAPEARKADAVRQALLGPVSTACPASILRTCSHARMYLDPESARDLGEYLENAREG